MVQAVMRPSSLVDHLPGSGQFSVLVWSTGGGFWGFDGFQNQFSLESLHSVLHLLQGLFVLKRSGIKELHRIKSARLFWNNIWVCISDCGRQPLSTLLRANVLQLKWWPNILTLVLWVWKQNLFLWIQAAMEVCTVLTCTWTHHRRTLVQFQPWKRRSVIES